MKKFLFMLLIPTYGLCSTTRFECNRTKFIENKVTKANSAEHTTVLVNTDDMVITIITESNRVQMSIKQIVYNDNNETSYNCIGRSGYKVTVGTDVDNKAIYFITEPDSYFEYAIQKMSIE